MALPQRTFDLKSPLFHVASTYGGFPKDPEYTRQRIMDDYFGSWSRRVLDNPENYDSWQVEDAQDNKATAERKVYEALNICTYRTKILLGSLLLVGLSVFSVIILSIVLVNPLAWILAGLIYGFSEPDTFTIIGSVLLTGATLFGTWLAGEVTGTWKALFKWIGSKLPERKVAVRKPYKQSAYSKLKAEIRELRQTAKDKYCYGIKFEVQE
jgi:hypothetical protein